MNRELSLVVSFVAAVLFILAVLSSKTLTKLGIDGTTFMVYWAFLYYVFHDKNKDE